MPEAAKSNPAASTEIRRRAMTYMIGHQMCNKTELRARLAEAKSDPELKGKLRDEVLYRYNELINKGR